MQLRKFLIKWLFKYPVPEYLHAIQFYKNLEWDKETKDEYRTTWEKKFMSFILRKEVRRGNVSWTLWDINNYHSTGVGTISEYEQLIEHLDHVLRYGVLKVNQLNN